jgi:hypothetical protein
MNNAFVQQSKRNIENLMISGKYKEALDLCNAILSRYPEEKEFETLRKNAEKKLAKLNDEAIDEKIKEISPLWDQGKYEEILSELKNLLQYSPENTKIKNLQGKAQSLYIKQVEKLKKQFLGDQIEKLNRLLEKDPDRVISELYILERSNPGNKDVENLAKEIRRELISKKIKAKEELLNSSKFESIESFIDSLKKIDSKNPEITKLEKLTKQRKLNAILEEKKELIYKGENYMDTLIRLKKYQAVIKIAEEVLSIDKNDKTAGKMLKKARNAYFDKTRDESIEMMNKDNEKTRDEYKNNKNNFIKI